ncbi:P-loop ATPase, Sll1717 family [Enterococcus mundtii]|uniref:P-loop ATPase, Sll1717 family n=1 Tax=Enterococcus mundtii TaxID=53346 RepID=UPI001FB9FF79|nr:hypothetical protein [Enterococcus mundtii]GKS56303.1 hypothetical protein EMLAB_29180 [Enterococcus mundtii]
MTPGVKIKEIDFGKTDGKFEAEKSNFTDLFFDNNSYYSRLANDNCFIIYGYKGTGKTLLANYFAKIQEKNSHTKKLYSNDFIQEKLLSFSKNSFNTEELIIFWKYVYLREIGDSILKKVNKLPFFCFRRKKMVENLKSLLADVQLIVDNTEALTEKIISGGFETQATSLPLVSLKGSTNEVLKESKKTENVRATYINLIRELETEVIKNIKPRDQFYLIYDDMDQLEEYLDRKQFIDLMKQMIYAADNFNDILRQNKKNTRVIHVMRSDILELLTADSSNLIKTVTDFGIEIDWYSPNRKKPASHPLMQMVLHKVKKSIPEYQDLANNDVYELLFHKSDPILNFLLERSFGRPREIVRFLAIVQEAFPDSTKIELDMLKTCMPDYSKWFYESMISEIKVNPHSESIKKVIEIIRTRGSKRFTYNKLLNYIGNKPGLSLPDNLMEVLQEMYTLGLIAILNTNGTIELFYRKNAPTVANEHTKFVVHYGFLNYLNLT